VLPHTYVALFAAPLTAIITVGTSGVTDQSAAFDPHQDVGPVYIKTKRLLLNKGNNKITELRTILQRESQNS
jgi:hypothetical protein